VYDATPLDTYKPSDEVLACLSVWSKVHDLYIIKLMPLPLHNLLLQYNPEQLSVRVLAYPGGHRKNDVK